MRPLLGADRLASAVFDALLIVGHELAAPGQATDVIVAVPEEGSLRSECAGGDFAESILTARKRERIARVVVASSLAAVGPLGPGRDLRFEGEPARPITSEGRAFLALEQRLLEIRDEEKFELVILRGGPLFDDEEGGALDAWLGELAAIPDAMAQSAADDAPSYLHREDFALGVAIAAAEGDWIYHLGDNVCPTIGELAQQFMRAFPGWFPGPSVPVAPAPRPGRCHWRIPNHRAEREFEYPLHRRLPSAAEGIASRAREGPPAIARRPSSTDLLERTILAPPRSGPGRRSRPWGRNPARCRRPEPNDRAEPRFVRRYSARGADDVRASAPARGDLGSRIQ